MSAEVAGKPKRRPVTAADAVLVIDLLRWGRPNTLNPVTVSTIRTWAGRGKVRKYGPGWDGRQKYELTDIVRCAVASAAARSDRGMNDV